MVMFWCESEFKTEMPRNVMATSYATYIKSFDQQLFTDAEVSAAVEAIRTGALAKSWATRKAHLASLAARHSSTAWCAKCGNPMVLRTARSGPNSGGKFYGCSAYPKCRHTPPYEATTVRALINQEKFRWYATVSLQNTPAQSPDFQTIHAFWQTRVATTTRLALEFPNLSYRTRTSMIAILRSLLWVVALLACINSLTYAQAAYPIKPIRLIVPFAPGGSNDIMARITGQKFSESFGQQVIIDNRGGASGIIGTDLAAKAAPDGYTLLMMSLTLAVNPSLYKKLPYDTEKDLMPVSLVASAPLILVVHPSLPVKSLKEFIAHAKANPGKFNFGSGGPGTTPHLAGEMLKSMAGLQMTHVPYKGGGPALADLIGGQLQLMLENIPSTLPHVKSGKLRVLALSGLKRSALVPEVPTLDEAGLKGYEIVGWNGLFLPAGTPNAIVSRLHAETVKALALPDIKERLAGMGAEGVGNTPAQFSAFVKAEIKKWAQVVRAAGLRLE